MTKRIEATQNNSEKGVAIVEAAIILLLFLTLILGVFEAGRFMNTQQILTNAAREGARFAVAPLSGTDTLPSTGEITTHVEAFLSSGGIPCAACVQVAPINVTSGFVTTTYTQVTVDNDYQVITLPIFDALQITLQGKAQMRNETSN